MKSTISISGHFGGTQVAAQLADAYAQRVAARIPPIAVFLPPVERSEDLVNAFHDTAVDDERTALCGTPGHHLKTQATGHVAQVSGQGR